MVCEVKLEERDFDVGVQGFGLLDHGTDFGFIAPTEDDLSGISFGKGECCLCSDGFHSRSSCEDCSYGLESSKRGEERRLHLVPVTRSAKASATSIPVALRLKNGTLGDEVDEYRSRASIRLEKYDLGFCLSDAHLCVRVGALLREDD